MQSRMAQRLANYVSSEKGKQQIKSALKNGLYYGIPVAGFAGGVKYTKDQFSQLDQRIQQQQNQQLIDDIAQVRQDGQNNAAAIEQVDTKVDQTSERIQDTYTSLRRVEAALDPLQRRINQTATGGQVIDLHGTLGQMRRDIATSLNQFGTSLNQKAALRGIAQVGWDDANIEQNFKRFCDTGKTGMLSDQAVDLRKCSYLSNYEVVNRAVLVNGKDGKPYLCVSLDISKENWGGTIEDEWADKKTTFKRDIKDMFVMPDGTHVVLVARDQKTKNWLN